MTAALKTSELAGPLARRSLRVQRLVSHPSNLVTDSLGFRLELSITVEGMAGRGQHKTFEKDGKVTPDAIHKIAINSNLRGDGLTRTPIMRTSKSWSDWTGPVIQKRTSSRKPPRAR